MAISINSDPPSVGLVRNPLNFNVETDNYIQTSGVKAVSEFEFTDIPSTNETLIFDWNGITVTMTCVAADTQDDSGNQFPGDSGGQTLAQWLAGVAQYFKDNHYINEDFTVTYDATSLIFTSRVTGEAYEITFTGTAQGTGSVTTQGTDTVYAENFFIAATIYIEDEYGSGVYTKLPAVFHKPDDDQVADFDVSEYLDAYLSAKTNLNLPAYNQSAASIAEKLSKRYYVEFAEFYGDPATFKKIYTSKTLRAIKAGVTKTEWKRFSSGNWAGLYFAPANQVVAHQANILTWRKERYVTETQQEFIYYLIPTSEATEKQLVLKATIHYTDGSNETVTALDGILTENGDFDGNADGWELVNCAYSSGEVVWNSDQPGYLRQDVGKIFAYPVYTLKFTITNGQADDSYLIIQLKSHTTSQEVQIAQLVIPDGTTQHEYTFDGVTDQFSDIPDAYLEFVFNPPEGDSSTCGLDNIMLSIQVESTPGEIIIFPAGYGQLGIGSYQPAKTVHKYELWVQRNNNLDDDEEKITNGTFPSNADGWTLGGNASYDPAPAANVYWQVNPGAPYLGSSLAQAGISLIAGQLYTLEFDLVDTTIGVDLLLDITFDYDGSPEIIAIYSEAPPAGSQHITVTFLATETGTGELIFNWSGEDAFGAIDNITMYPADYLELTKKIAFYLDPAGFLDKFFLYENSLGAFETLRCIGPSQRNVETFKTELEFELPYDYTVQTPATLMRDDGYRETLSQSTGMVEEVFRTLVDFIKSKHIFLVDKDIQELIPVSVPKDKYLLDESDKVFPLKFDVVFDKEKNFTDH